MEMTALRMVVLGCGRMGVRTPDRTRNALPPGWLPLSHAEAAAAIPEIKLVGVCDTDRTRAQEAADTFGVSAVFTDFREMLTTIRPELLSVATRTHGRCDAIIEAAAAGVRGIHAEKPLGRSLAECRRALDAVAANDSRLTFGTVRRFMGAYRQARLMVDSGTVGPLEQITIEFGSGQLMWTHPHSADLAVFFSRCTAIEHVQATASIDPADWDGRTLDADPRVESASIRFANGVNATITRGDGLHVHLAGPKGTVSVIADGSWIEWKRKPAADSSYPTEWGREIPAPTPSGTEQALRELVASIRCGARIGIAAEEIASGAEILAAIAWSTLHHGRRVTVGEVPEDFAITGRSGQLYA